MDYNGSKLIHVHKRGPWSSLEGFKGIRSTAFNPFGDFHMTVTSKCTRWRFKSPASRLFTQPFIQVQIKENIKAPRHWPLCGEFTMAGEYPSQRASNAGNVSIWWRHHDQLHPQYGGYMDLDNFPRMHRCHCDVIMSTNATQITGVSIVCSTLCSGADQRQHQSSASLAFVRGTPRWPVNSPHKGPVTGQMFLFDDVIIVFDHIRIKATLNLLWPGDGDM